MPQSGTVCLLLLFTSSIPSFGAEAHADPNRKFKELEWMIGEYEVFRPTKKLRDWWDVDNVSIAPSHDRQGLWVKYFKKSEPVRAEYISPSRISFTARIYAPTVGHAFASEGRRGKYTLKRHPKDKDTWLCKGVFKSNEAAKIYEKIFRDNGKTEEEFFGITEFSLIRFENGKIEFRGKKGEVLIRLKNKSPAKAQGLQIDMPF